MSADGAIEKDWGDGRYRFCLKIAQLSELQEKINSWRAAIGANLIGPRTLLKELSSFDAWPSDVNEVIRLGLIGGSTPGDGMTAAKAFLLVGRYCDNRPLVESTAVAHDILASAVVGVIDDPVGKTQAERTASEATTASSSPQSMGPGKP